MSFSSKRILIGMGVGIVMLVAYLVRALGPQAPASEDVKAWAILILIFIGVSIVAMIVVETAFHILYSIGVAIKEREQSDERVERIISATIAEDERDKMINLKSSRIGQGIAGAGALATLAALALGASVVFAMHILLGAFFVASFIEGIASIYMNERGF